MKSVINAAVRRNLEATAARMGPEALAAAGQGIRIRTEDDVKAALEQAAAPALPNEPTRSPVAQDIAAQKIGNSLYLSSVTALDAQSGQAITRYEQLAPHERAQLRSLGFDCGQPSIDLLEAPIVCQSYRVLQRIVQLAQSQGLSPQTGDMVRLVQYVRDMQHYPAYHRVRSLFFPHGVVSTVVEVSRLLPSDEVLIAVEATIVRG